MSYADKQILMSDKELAQYRRELDVFDNLQSDTALKPAGYRGRTAKLDTLNTKTGKVITNDKKRAKK